MYQQQHPLTRILNSLTFAGLAIVLAVVSANPNPPPPDECAPTAMAKCTDPLKVVTDNRDLGFATSMDELKEMCPKLMDGLRCIDDFTIRCLDNEHRAYFNTLYAGTTQVIVDLCQEGAYQLDYLKHAPCMRQVQAGYERCASEYQQRIKSLNTAATVQQERSNEAYSSGAGGAATYGEDTEYLYDEYETVEGDQQDQLDLEMNNEDEDDTAQDQDPLPDQGANNEEKSAQGQAAEQGQVGKSRRRRRQAKGQDEDLSSRDEGHPGQGQQEQHLQQQQEQGEQSVQLLCCSFQKYLYCSESVVNTTCGHETAKFTKSFLDRMSGPLIQGHCQAYEYGSEGCRLASGDPWDLYYPAYQHLPTVAIIESEPSSGRGSQNLAVSYLGLLTAIIPASMVHHWA